MRPPEPFRVRLATRDDADLLFPMFEAFYGPYFQPKTVEAIRGHMAAAAAMDHVLVAEEGGVPLGFASLRLIPQVEADPPHAELSDLFVREPHRRRGVGRALMDFAERLARDRGCARMYLVTGFDNEGARAFYRAAGFRDFALQMEKDLGATE